MGAFPKVDRPRTIWAGVTAGGEPLSDLAELLETAFEPMGFPRERRRFHPHLTLGRVKGRGSLEALSSRITKLGDEHELGIARVDELLLMSSDLKPAGPVYTRMATLKFGS